MKVHVITLHFYYFTMLHSLTACTLVLIHTWTESSRDKQSALVNTSSYKYIPLKNNIWVISDLAKLFFLMRKPQTCIKISMSFAAYWNSALVTECPQALFSLVTLKQPHWQEELVSNQNPLYNFCGFASAKNTLILWILNFSTLNIVFFRIEKTNKEVQDSKLPRTQPGPAAGQIKLATNSL